jgi:aspartokinase-like uncharacterized kinase
MRPTVIKVGGSLYDLPDLGPRLLRFLDGQRAPLLVPGGGPTAEVVRAFDRDQGLGEEKGHWLALRALSLNAHFLADLLGGRGEVVSCLDECPRMWERGRVPILDAHAFAVADEGRPGCLPHGWEATSDSVAARVAEVSGARELILLKSVTVPVALPWAEAGRRGMVDAVFAEVLARAGESIPVRAVNLRSEASEPEA